MAREILEQISPAELAVRIFGPGAEPLPGFSDAVRAALDRIGEREKIVFLQRLAGKTLEEVGKELGGLTRERVRQIEAQAKRRLRGKTVKYVSVSTEFLPPPPLSVEDIEKLLAHASRDQREAWQEFRGSFSPEQTMLWRKYWREKDSPQRALVWKEFTNSLTDEQRELWRAYRRASAYTKKVRAALRRAREGKRVYAL
jgi:hypothetical protein